MAYYLAALAGLSAGSCGFVYWLLQLPWRDELVPMRAPEIVAEVPDMTLDTIGLL